MLRSLTLLALFILGASPAFAMEPAPRGESRSFSMTAAGGFGLIADVARDTETTGIGRHVTETTMAGLAWQYGGFKAAATAGLLGYDWSGVGAGQARVASFALNHALATTAGGTLSIELRHSRLWEGESQLEMNSARLGWSLKF
ncbi:MAG: hypothetical protein FJX11_22035 [Alphaproteobacteria bacterium]|nr:hypothetical protein [Alphaproteobacteria bacterium]